MHLDPVVARRFMYGEVVVHGIHLLLHALGVFAKRTPKFRKLLTANTEFRAPVKVDTPVVFHCEFADAHKAVLVAETEQTLAMRSVVTWSEEAPDASSIKEPTERWPTDPAVLTAKDMDNLRGSAALLLDRTAAARLLPAIPLTDMQRDVALLLASTRIVGMYCPGYHSMYSQLSMDFGAGAGPASELDYQLTDFDERFNMADIGLASRGASGKIKAFLRPAPQQQPSIDAIAALVNKGEFAGRRALVIGGSRGLGEISAKIMAAGGADVTVTYRHGADDADRVCQELQQFGANATSVQYVAGNDQEEFAAFAARWQPTDLLYYATPAIKKTDTQFFNQQYFQRFADVYVRGFSELTAALVGTAPLQTIIYPSSVAVEELTKGMMEYSAAKMAGETICRYIAKRNPNIRVVMPRLPRMATDQTVSMLGDADDAAVDYFVSLLRGDLPGVVL